MNILIIGCGYVGLALIPLLQSLPADISVTTRHEYRVPELNLVASKVYLIETLSDITEIVANYDVVIFCAAAGARGQYKSAYLQNAEAIAAGLSSTNRKQQVIYTSSTSVYGDHQGNWVDEQSKLMPMNQEAEILIQTEKVLLEAASDSKRICIFRLGGIVGPGRSIEERLIHNVGGTFPGDGMNYTNLSPLKMIVEGVRFAVSQRLEGVFNLCSDEHSLRKDLYEQICQEHNLPPIKWDSSIPDRHGGNKRVSSDKFKETIHTYSS